MISIRPTIESDFYILMALFNDEAVCIPMGFPKTNDLKMVQALLPEIQYSICLDEQPIGMITCEKLDSKTGNLGFMLLPNYQHHGYMKQALMMFFKVIKKEGMKTLEADTYMHNTASDHLLEKVGFKAVKRIKRQYLTFPNEWVDATLYKKKL